MQRYLKILVLIVFPLFSFGQNSKDSLKILIESIEYIKENSSNVFMDIPITFENSNYLNRKELGASGIEILTHEEIFNRAYCHWLVVKHFKISGDLAVLNIEIKEACKKLLKNSVINLKMKKVKNDWVIY